MKIEIRDAPFDPYVEIITYQRALPAGRYGATASFVGTMRDYNEGRRVHGMMLEYYPGMTEKHIARICEQATARWSLLDCLVMHRVGRVEVNEPIVVVAVWTGHRGDALDACRFIIEDLKSQAPFWKKEQLNDGEEWVGKNTSGYDQ